MGRLLIGPQSYFNFWGCFLGPFFLQAFQDLRVKAPLFFVDRTRTFGGLCEADLQKIFLRQISKLTCRSKQYGRSFNNQEMCEKVHEIS